MFQKICDFPIFIGFVVFQQALSNNNNLIFILISLLNFLQRNNKNSEIKNFKHLIFSDLIKIICSQSNVKNFSVLLLFLIFSFQSLKQCHY